MEDLKYTQQFIKIYGIFTILMIIFQVSSLITVFPEVYFPSKFSLVSILGSIGSIGNFLLSIFLYSIPQYPIINYLLWISRSISVLEILNYIRQLF